MAKFCSVCTSWWDSGAPGARASGAVLCGSRLSRAPDCGGGGVVVVLDEARATQAPVVQLHVDNAGALSQRLWGRAGTGPPAQQRILCRVAHHLHWQGCCLQLGYVPSDLDPVDPMSRWWSGSDATSYGGASVSQNVGVSPPQAASTAGAGGRPRQPDMGRAPDAARRLTCSLQHVRAPRPPPTPSGPMLAVGGVGRVPGWLAVPDTESVAIGCGNGGSGACGLP